MGVLRSGREISIHPHGVGLILLDCLFNFQYFNPPTHTGWDAALGALNAGVMNAPAAVGDAVKLKSDSNTIRTEAELDIRQRRETAEKEGKALEAYGTTDPERQVAFREAEIVANRFGNALGLSEGNAEGTYQNGKITINKNTNNPVMEVLFHELTHHLETKKDYASFAKYALDYIANDMGADVQTLKENIIKDYAEGGITLDDHGAERELVAKFTESKLFRDEAAVNRLYNTNPSLFQRIYYWIQDSVKKLTGTQEEKRLLEAQNLFQKVMKSGQKLEAESGDNVQFKIDRDATNTPFVEIEEDILKGVPQEKWAKTVRNSIKEQFNEPLIIGGTIIESNSNGRKEITDSESARTEKRKRPEVYADKLRATKNSKEIIEAAQNWIEEEPEHERKDDIYDFGRGKVKFRVGGNDYLADVVIAQHFDGKNTLYDITRISPTNIKQKETSEAIPVYPSPEDQRRTSKVSEGRITEFEPDVKPLPSPGAEDSQKSYGRKLDDLVKPLASPGTDQSVDTDRKYMRAVESGDMETAQRLVNDAAERNGYTEDSGYQGTSAFNGSAPSDEGYYSSREEKLQAWENGDYISIHPPTRGGTISSPAFFALTQFQSTHPHGVGR